MNSSATLMGPAGAPALHIQGPSRVPDILAGNIIPEVIASISFFARVYARAWLLRNWGLDDTFLTLSWASDAFSIVTKPRLT